KGLAVVAGTQYRHHAKFKLTIDEIHKGRIGRIVAGRAYYNAGTLWHRGQKKEWSDVEYQVRNWLYFDWLSGDHIVEQHIHTIDVTNWVMQSPPVRAVAMGGRQVRSQQKYGNIYDHFAVDYEYPGGAHVTSMCRQMRGTSNHVGAYFEGTKGVAAPYQGKIHTDPVWTSPDLRGIGTAYVQEHTDLIESVRAGKPLNETEQVCDSTLTAIMGREAAYTGQMVTWEQMLSSELDYGVTEEFKPLAVRPVPMPGPRQ
ncbi:MAG: Gfo/Idh/MocA family oxidoreductase, partial [Planctomycetota bacterium]|nr:Gfo/Idh/MocA family oxidoreductase [Planctomycetota bacterium]